MSTERGGGAEQSRSFQSKGAVEVPDEPSPDERNIGEPAQPQTLSGAALSQGREEVVTGETGRGIYQVQTAVVSESEQSPLASKSEPSQATGGTTSTEGLSPQSESSQAFSRQVIAVSASKGPAAFFNLARKFLVTDEMCDLSALEGAIVSAVDAAHLLERSKLATIVRVQTSYVAVEPKRKKLQSDEMVTPSADSQQAESTTSAAETRPAHDVMSVDDAGGAPTPSSVPSSDRDRASTQTATDAQGEFPRSRKQGRAKGAPLRRARIIITVKRTPEYKQWLEENPLHAAITGEELEGVSSPHASLAADPPRRQL
uniref:Uncharacterized protein n=1 Tax=Pseudictyota dubia TaxID=2749911 RepID=A0A7R9ZA97_9STRA|mmetsp:Transcript_33294/g.61339  ORF Transcript_33294/g.61339 Transcript_33294/m.61339 type:complete len:315 (+) Transcript_33294:337-1281(+)|eukprot:CAMPEP_0197439326 /NCGR_PEP_ID=MMETSP1175-20131217/6093_1 /TAXON_ID=1003142 /ORGANISM="Triceratium dubium, Strain CCMP147" /LENGTH=314 /DNA_ID=CAMNT_0042969221 /DNA_START=336 /DNA_END=1280 /DNA_ORIENTATION=-